MAVELSRRGLITGLVSLIAAPAIVRANSLMPISSRALKPRIVQFDPIYKFCIKILTDALPDRDPVVIEMAAWQDAETIYRDLLRMNHV